LICAIGKCRIMTFTGLICSRCQSVIARQLSDLLELWKAAHDELTPGRGGDGGGSEQSIGVNVSALSFINGADILGILHEWEKITRADLRLTPPALLPLPKSLEEDITTTIAFAMTHLAWMATQEWIMDFADEVSALWKLGNVAAKKFTEKMRRIDCPSDDDQGLPCRKSLRVYPDDPSRIFECSNCHSEWSTLRLVMVALETEGAEIWLDTEAIARWLGIGERAVIDFGKKNHIPSRMDRQVWELRTFLRLRRELDVA
jgi:hypothetical protein